MTDRALPVRISGTPVKNVNDRQSKFDAARLDPMHRGISKSLAERASRAPGLEAKAGTGKMRFLAQSLFSEIT
ncbi:hypothetical protein LTR35_002611 [Friedmanniomyces endolithicus]|uniref:Uncharacterized protein n=1 Tax=Friedmanniomyces endolithicus TaxID=329885 RepID=A0AAN6FVG1_9PEZI|nr:hypothetical protein LTR35_002611 [Friedmanniomyces endolithicus]KAK0323562.1 hypothetical protein LTR82_005309 [Friedmanniomyces endolithicus]KAK1061572.1 hypothetical protein LTR74_010963 [Friedmanniomyces endolithicus]